MYDYNEAHDDYNEYHLKEKNTCFYLKHPFLSHLLIALSVLLGAYLSFYTISDWHFKKMLDPIHQIKKMEKILQQEERAMQKTAQREWRTEQTLNNYIQLKEIPNAYIITINLLPFGNNDDNISVTTDDNTLTIHAICEKEQSNATKTFAISQSYTFNKKANLNKITKERKGNKYIITVPIS